MVAFKNPIVFFLVIPSGSTSGERIVIDGVNGVIDVFGPDSTGPNSGLVAQLGNGVGLTVFGSAVTMAMEVFGAKPQLAYWINTDPSNRGGLVISNDGSINTQSVHFASTITGNQLNTVSFLAGNIFQMGFFNFASGIFEGGKVSGFNTQLLLHCQVENPSAPFIQMNGTGSTVFINLEPNASPPRFLNIRRGTGGTQQPVIIAQNDVWTTLTLLNGWTAAVIANYFNGLRIRKDSAGTVFLDGAIVAPAAPANTLIAGIPAGYFPSVRKLFISFYSTNAPKLFDLIVGGIGDTVFGSALGFGTDFGTAASGTAIVSCQWPGEF